MKKKIFTILSILILSTSVGIANCATTSNTPLSEAIKLYKAGNYSQCYVQLEQVIKNDPANALAYYYMAMTSAQIGKKDEAISNYEKSLSLNPMNNNLSRYAKKGKRCLETPDKCEESVFESVEEEFILGKRTHKLTDEVKSDYERLKIENLMREMNRNDSLEIQRFKEFKDFSSVPNNDEIVAALRVLQNAGFNGLINNQTADISTLLDSPQQNSIVNLMGSSAMSPQLIQSLLTNSLTQGF